MALLNAGSKGIKATVAYAGKAVKNGFFHILTGKTIAQCMSALSALLLPGLLAATQFGTLSNPDNILNYILIFNGVGMSSAVLRYCSVYDSPQEKKAYFKFGLRFGLLSDALLVIVAAVLLYIFNLKGFLKINPSEIPLLFGFILIPFFAYALDCTQGFLRSTGNNKAYAQSATVFSAGYAIFQVLLVFVFKLGGVAPGRNLGYLVALIFTFYILLTSPIMQSKEKVPRLQIQEKKAMIVFALSSMLANTFSLIMPQNEQFIFNHFVTDLAARAEYKVANSIPQSVQFIAVSVAFFIYPYFAKHYKDGKWVYNNAKKVLFAMSAGMFVLAGLGIIFTPLILKIYPKGNYCNPESIAVMRIFWVSFAINGALKMTVGNILAAIGEIRFNLFTALFSSTIHVAICWVCISKFGIYGAAYGLLSAYLLIAVVSIFYLKYYCKKLESRKDDTTIPQNDEDIEADEKDLL